jgi:hypothetical protein
MTRHSVLVNGGRRAGQAGQKNVRRLSITGRLTRRSEEARLGAEGGSPQPFRPSRRRTMRVMIIIKASAASEAGELPSAQLLTEMGHFNEELVKAGMLLAGEGLHPSVHARRVHFSGSARSVVDGPFTETKELIAGFWLWQVKSIEEAVEWVKRIPNSGCPDSEVDIRPVFSCEDFEPNLTPEHKAQEQRLRETVAARS